MNLISGTHRSCERKEYAFMVFREYTIISLQQQVKRYSLSSVEVRIQKLETRKSLPLIISFYLFPLLVYQLIQESQVILNLIQDLQIYFIFMFIFIIIVILVLQVYGRWISTIKRCKETLGRQSLYYPIDYYNKTCRFSLRVAVAPFCPLLFVLIMAG